MMKPKQPAELSVVPAPGAGERSVPARARVERAGPATPVGPAGGGPAGPAGRGPRRTARDGGEDALLLGLVRQFAAAYLEVEAGRRGPRQLVAAGWARHPSPATCAPAGGAPGRVVSVAGTRTSPSRFDAVALVRRGPRVGAICIHLTRHAGGWVVADARCPEDVANGRSDQGPMAARPGLR